jgi:hypothetical protein
MRLTKRTIIILGISILICGFLSYIYVLPIFNEINSDNNIYATHVADRNNYKLHTTPLSKSVVDDICSKLMIEKTSENCKDGAVVYMPDFYDDIKTYFWNLPSQDRTYHTVQDKLGAYLIECAKPNPNGHFRCRYDLRGDGVYSIAFYFDENDIYFEIMANIGGS